jgi:penicillin amidase
LIRQAYARGQLSSNPTLASLASAPAVRKAMARINTWKLTAPSGIPEGYDAGDVNGVPGVPTGAEITESAAATIYAVWRGQFIRKTIDATLDGVPLPPSVTLPKPGAQLTMTALKALLERPQPGIGASGINFFNAPANSAEDRRDILILASLADALTRLAGPDFAAAFGGSTDQLSYRWGKLHRIVFEHPLGGPFDVPPAFGAFPDPLGTALPGFPSDGGFGTVDVGNHDPRAQTASDFMFNHGPVNRYVAVGAAAGVSAQSIWPGGTSGVPGSPFYVNMLPYYLTNDTIPLLFQAADLATAVYSIDRFVPSP